jgi:hypothetical protein
MLHWFSQPTLSAFASIAAAQFFEPAEQLLYGDRITVKIDLHAVPFVAHQLREERMNQEHSGFL